MSSEYLESPVILNDLKDAKNVYVKERFYDIKTLQKIGEKLTEYAITKNGCVPTCIYDKNSKDNGIKHKQFDKKAFVLLINACSYKRETTDKFIKIIDVWKTTINTNLLKQEDLYSSDELEFKKYLIEVEKMQELKARNSMNVIHRFHDAYTDESLTTDDNDKLIMVTFGEKWFRQACFSTKTKYRRAFRDYKNFLSRRELYDY